MSHDPYAPTRSGPRSGRDAEAPLTTFTRRLISLGASREEVGAITARWDDFGEDWTPDHQAAWLAADDDSISAELLRIRAEWQRHTTSPAEEAQAVNDLLASGLVEQLLEGNVQAVLETVGSDRVWAMAVYQVEAAGQARKGILTKLQPLVEG